MSGKTRPCADCDGSGLVNGSICSTCNGNGYIRLPQGEKPAGGSLAGQVGGDHYKNMAIQPIEYIHRNGIGFAEGAVIKYVSRWRAKNGVEDLKKARHMIDLLIGLEETS